MFSGIEEFEEFEEYGEDGWGIGLLYANVRRSKMSIVLSKQKWLFSHFVVKSKIMQS